MQFQGWFLKVELNSRKTHLIKVFRNTRCLDVLVYSERPAERYASRRSAEQSGEGSLKAPSPGHQSRKILTLVMSWHGASPRCLQPSPSSPTNEQSCSQRGSAEHPGSLPAPKLLLSSHRGEQQPRVESWHRHRGQDRAEIGTALPARGKERGKNVYGFSLV